MSESVFGSLRNASLSRRCAKLRAESSAEYGLTTAMGSPRSVTMISSSRAASRIHFPVLMCSSRIVIRFMCTMCHNTERSSRTPRLDRGLRELPLRSIRTGAFPAQTAAMGDPDLYDREPGPLRRAGPRPGCADHGGRAGGASSLSPGHNLLLTAPSIPAAPPRSGTRAASFSSAIEWTGLFPSNRIGGTGARFSGSVASARRAPRAPPLPPRVGPARNRGYVHSSIHPFRQLRGTFSRDSLRDKASVVPRRPN